MFSFPSTSLSFPQPAFRILRKYLEYYHGARTHLALDKDAPEHRERESTDGGKVIALPMVGGLHHRYARRSLSERLDLA